MAELAKIIYQEKNVLTDEVCFDYPCRGCGKNIRLWFNGGELDKKECCGFTYSLESQGYDFIVREVRKDEARKDDL